MLCHHNDYSVLRCDRPTDGGGVCTFVDTHLNCVRIPPPREYAELGQLCIDIIQDQWRHRFVIVYRPPRYTVQQTESIMSCLNFFLQFILWSDCCDDFNMPKIDLNNGFDITRLPAL